MQTDCFEIFITVTRQDLDDMQHVNNVVYLQWVQDAALAHWNAKAGTAIREKYKWVVLRHEIDYKSPGYLHDALVLKTWVYDYNGVRSTRLVQIIRQKDNKLLAQASTSWCLLQAASGKPVRIGEDIMDLFKPQVQ